MITIGSATVRVYPPRKSGGRYAIAYRWLGERVLESRTTEAAALARARVLAKLLNSRSAASASVSVEEVLSLRQAQEAVKGTGVPLAVAAAEWRAAREKLGAAGTLADAAELWRRQQAAGALNVTTAAAVERFLAEKRADGIHPKYFENLARSLGKFTAAVGGKLDDVTPEVLTRWLSETGATGRTLANYREWLVTFFRWSKANRILPQDRSTAAELVRRKKWAGRPAELFTPADLNTLLGCAPKRLLPWLAIGALGGLRPSEICRLNWEDVDWQRRVIVLRAEIVHKTRRAREVPVCDRLAKILFEWREHVGPVCDSTATKMARDAVKFAAGVGVRWRKNGLRASFGSYKFAECDDERRVAAMMGHDPRTFFREYRNYCGKNLAVEWFGGG